jgi:hypothetical protein
MLDYAQHIATFKMGGAEFAATMPLLQDFIARAGMYNDKVKQMVQYPLPTLDISRREAERNPIR